MQTKRIKALGAEKTSALAPSPGRSGTPFSFGAIKDRLSHGPWPVVAGTAVGAAGVALAATIGVAEVALGVTLGYAAYEVFRRKVGLAQALSQAFALDRDLVL